MAIGHFRWGIVGTGGIANRFAEDLAFSSSGAVHAVGSRSEDRALEFQQRHGASRAFASYDELFADKEIDGVYLATPNQTHGALAQRALEAGKPVLLEKPFTVSREEAAALIELARSRHLALMEGMWSACLPQFDELRRLLGVGIVGDVRFVVAEHGIGFPNDPSHRIYDPALAGGALLDLGVYLLWFARFVLGNPVEVQVTSTLASTGVDAQLTLGLRYRGGAQASLTMSTETLLANRAVIAGTDGRVELEATWYRPSAFDVVERASAIGRDGDRRRFDFRDEQHGLRFEADEFARVVRAGALESPLLDHKGTLDVLEVMDEVRARIGLRYPFEPPRSEP